MNAPIIIRDATLYLGDCLEVLPQLGSNSIDSIVCDPPYELGFMGKSWDNTGIANDVEMWAQCLRVLKPGGHLLAFSGTRTYHRMVCAIEDSGFEIRDQIMWLYGSGFPKSLDASKAIDKASGASREVVGVKSVGNRNRKGEGFRHAGDASGIPVTLPSTDAAQQWAGCGTALKPAHEPIVVARKPIIGTVAANILAHGSGALNIDACRVRTDENLNGGAYSVGGRAAAMTGDEREGAALGMFRPGAGAEGDYIQPSGRWPANVIHDGSSEVLEAFTKFGDDKGQSAHLARRNTDKTRNTFGGFAGSADANFAPHDGPGSAARFFYCAKASRADRNEGCDSLPDRDGGMNSNTSGQHITRRDGWQPQPVKNNHPTVKPTELMAYLCRLVTPPRGVVLDQFMGSGSTGKAAAREGFRFIGIDMTPEYVEIARARIQFEFDRVEQTGRDAARQTSLFSEVE